MPVNKNDEYYINIKSGIQSEDDRFETIIFDHLLSTQ